MSLFSYQFLCVILSGISIAHALTSYANDFVDPDLILNGNFGPTTMGAQRTIVQWAQELDAKGPWSES